MQSGDLSKRLKRDVSPIISARNSDPTITETLLINSKRNENELLPSVARRKSLSSVPSGTISPTKKNGSPPKLRKFVKTMEKAQSLVNDTELRPQSPAYGTFLSMTTFTCQMLFVLYDDHTQIVPTVHHINQREESQLTLVSLRCWGTQARYLVEICGV
jgi:hypothetical protein